jgi:serine/threonine protein kinase
MDDQVGQVFGNYRAEELLGTGGMGRVYRARHQHLGWLAALKVMHPQLSADPAFRARFHREALTTARLKHPHIITLLDFGEQDDALYLVMELVNGGSLRTLLRNRTSAGSDWSLALGLDLVRQAALGLDYAHAQGAIHRDIKPDNLLLAIEQDDSGRSRYTVKITDYGLAHLAEGSALTASGAMVGTPAYMSPEQCQGHELDPRTDIYSLGVVLYEVATGRTPFTTRTISDAVYHHVFVPPPPPRSVLVSVPPALDTIIMRCLAKQPAERFATAGELAAALAALLELPATDALTQHAPDAAAPETSAATIASPLPVPSSTPPLAAEPPAPSAVSAVGAVTRRSSRWLLVAALVAVLALALVAGVLAMMNGRDSGGGGGGDQVAASEATPTNTPAPPPAFARDAEQLVTVVSRPDFAVLLGAPWDAPQPAVIRFQEFERGVLLVLDNVSGDGGILAAVTTGDGRGYFHRFASDEVADLPEVVATATPTDDGQQPEAPFDRLLANEPDLEVALGVPVQGSGGRAVFQQFEHGLAVWLYQTARVWLFYGDSPTAGDGEWEVVWLPLEPHPLDTAYGAQQIAQVAQSDALRDVLGAPLSEPEAVVFPAQEFERGLLVETSFLAGEEPDLEYAVLALEQFGSQANGSYRLFYLGDYSWVSPPDETPPGDRFPAAYPFSLVWGNEPELRAALRWAVAGEAHAAGMVQRFEHGTALWVEETYRVWIIYDADSSGRGAFWEAYPVS